MSTLTKKYIEISKTKGEFDPEKALLVLRELKKNYQKKSGLGGILKEFVLFVNRNLEAKSMRIYSSNRLNANEIKNIKIVVENKLKKNFLSIEAFCEPKLLGGVKVVAGDIVFDETILGKLESIKQNFKS